MDIFQPWHIILIVGIAVLFFGGKKLPELGKGLGEGLKGFKEGMKGITGNDDTPTPPVQQPVQQQTYAPPVQQQPIYPPQQPVYPPQQTYAQQPPVYTQPGQPLPSDNAHMVTPKTEEPVAKL